MSVSQRYGRLAARLGLDTHLHSLHHYSATELIAAGVDIRTVAGRLGHSGGGITTLRVYAAWLAEADQRAAGGLLARLPARPEPVVDPVAAVMANPRTPRERLAVELHRLIAGGGLAAGDFLPGIKQLAQERGLSTSTVQRAFQLLRDWGVVDGPAGERPRVAAAIVAKHRTSVTPVEQVAAAPNEQDGTGEGDRPPSGQAVDTTAASGDAPSRRAVLLDLVVRHHGEVVAQFSTDADPNDADDLADALLAAIRRSGRDDGRAAEYELDVRRCGALLRTFVVSRPRAPAR